MPFYVDLQYQITGELEAKHGGVGNDYGWALGGMAPPTINLSGSNILLGSLVSIDMTREMGRVELADGSLPIVGVAVGYFDQDRGELIEEDIAHGAVAAILTAGRYPVRIGAGVDRGDYVHLSATPGVAFGLSEAGGAAGQFVMAADGESAMAIIGTRATPGTGLVVIYSEDDPRTGAGEAAPLGAFLIRRYEAP